MFSVIFEVHPKAEQWDAYLGYAKLLRPELEAVDGFIDNIRYASRRRPGWLLSLSGWRDEKALIRWRTLAAHHAVQARGRQDVFSDYHLRVGQVTADSGLPAGQTLREQRLDETQTGAAKAVSIVEVDGELVDRVAPPDEGVAEWDVFDAVLTPGAAVLLVSWRDMAAAEAWEREGAGRVRRVRVIRDYGMFDRREAPQYHAPVERVGLGVLAAL